MMLWRRTVSSVSRRGVYRTVILGVTKIPQVAAGWADHLYDRQHGTDTLRKVELDDLDVESPNKERGIRYDPTRARPFAKLLRTLALPTDGGFVDFGCGKGRVLMLAADYGFRELTGVDFAASLCEQARANLATCRSRIGVDLRVAIYHLDAVDFAIEDEQSVFYFFNPFDATVMGEVMKNISESYAKKRRKLWIIYHNPVWREVLDSSPIVTRSQDFSFSGSKFVVYESNDDRATGS